MIDALILGKVNPFRSTSVGDPWQIPIDVPEINKMATNIVRDTLDEVRSTKRSGMALIKGDAGVGKTHLLARLRQKSKKKYQEFFFVNVRPLGDLSRIYLHILQEIMVCLRKKTADDLYTPLEHFIGEIISKSLQKEFTDGINPLARELGKSFAKDPMKIFSMDTSRIASGNLRKMAVNNLISTVNDVDIEFIEVLFHSIDPKLRPTALKWLNGIDVSEEDLEKLHVSASINNEERAIRIIQTFANLTNKPLLLSFDQLESIHYRFKKDNGILLFFDSLTNLYNACPNMLQLVMVQSAVWEEAIQKLIPEYSLQRIDYVADLEPLNGETATILAAARLQTTYDNSGIEPPYPSYPFTKEYLSILIKNVKGNPRLFLRQLRDKINEMKESGNIYELTPDNIREIDQSKAAPGIAPVTPQIIIPPKENANVPEEIQVKDLTDQDPLALVTAMMPKNEPDPVNIAKNIQTTDDILAQFHIPIPQQSTPKDEIPKKSESLIKFLDRKWADYAREYETEIYAFPHPVRRDFTKGVLYDILTESIDSKYQVFGIQILNVRVDQHLIGEDTKGLDLVFTYQTTRGPASVGIEINNSEHGATVFQSLRRLKRLVKGNIRYCFLLRDEELSLQRTATKTLDLAQSLTDFGGLYYIDFHSNQALQATKKLLDFASAGDLSYGDQYIKRKEAITFIFEFCLQRIGVFQRLFDFIKGKQNVSHSPTNASTASESNQALEAIISILKFNPSMTKDRLCALLNRTDSELEPVLQMLNIRGIVQYDGNNIMLL